MLLFCARTPLLSTSEQERFRTCGCGGDVVPFCKETEIGQRTASLVPHPSGLIRRFLACRHCLASARLLPPHQKSLKSCSLGCAKQFFRSGFLFRQGDGRREYFCIAKGGDAVWAKIRPKKPTQDLPPVAQPKESLNAAQRETFASLQFLFAACLSRRPTQELPAPLSGVKSCCLRLRIRASRPTVPCRRYFFPSIRLLSCAAVGAAICRPRADSIRPYAVPCRVPSPAPRR